MTSQIAKFLQSYASHRSHTAHITAIVWSPNGEYLATASGDWTVLIWKRGEKRIVAKLSNHLASVIELAWSPCGRRLASICKRGELLIWDVQEPEAPTLNLKTKVDADSKPVWKPDSSVVALASPDKGITFIDPSTGKLSRWSGIDISRPPVLSWNPSHELIVTTSKNFEVQLRNALTGSLERTLKGHHGSINDVAWSIQNDLLATASSDETVRIWNATTGRPIAILEGHTNSVYSVSFACSGQLLVTRSKDETIRIWRAHQWDTCATVKVPATIHTAGLEFNPRFPLLALKTNRDHTLSVWQVNEIEIADAATSLETTQYVNARVVLAGDTGVGKSGLSLVLTGKDFIPTESTHARHVWTFASSEAVGLSGEKENREILLWDLAGQPGYRLIHQLHLEEVAIALVVFDSRSEIEPLAGVFHWDRAIKQANHFAPNTIVTKRFLVSARTDRGGVPLSRSRIDTLISRLGFDEYFETSSKEGIGISDLRSAIINEIDWSSLPRVSSNILFQSIKQFILRESYGADDIVTGHEMFDRFKEHHPELRSDESLRQKFNTCIRLVESRGLIKRLSFGGLILLKPEILDSYASSIIDFARRNPEGVGFVYEDAIRNGDFFVPSETKLEDEKAERAICIATIESLLDHELAFREKTRNGTFLVFPSEFTRDWEELERPEGEVTIFRFEGPILSIYARLVVRLSHSNTFISKSIWKNACTFGTEAAPGFCGLFLNRKDEGVAELSIFFEGMEEEEVKQEFEAFSSEHLLEHSIPGKFEKLSVVVCTNCREKMSANAVKTRLERGLDFIVCPACDQRNLLRHVASEIDHVRNMSAVSGMEVAADRARRLAVAETVISGKEYAGQFDTFISYNSNEEKQAIWLAEQLSQKGIRPWIDVWSLRPGARWHEEVDKVIDSIGSAIVLVGENKATVDQERALSVIRESIRSARSRKEKAYFQETLKRRETEFKKENLSAGPWQSFEMDHFLRGFVERRLPVIPVVLKSVEGKPRLPGFLSSFTWVDMRLDEYDPLERIIWGITGNRGV